MREVLFPFHKVCNSLFNENISELSLGSPSCIYLAIDYMTTCITPVQAKALKA